MPVPNRYQAFGESKTAKQWSLDPRCQVGITTLSERLRKKWDVEKALLQPRNQFGPPKKHENAHCHIGSLSRGGQGKHHLPRFELDVPTRFTNSSQREPLVLPKWQVRAGADAFLSFKSRGV